MHVHASDIPLELPEHGIVEQIEFATESKSQFQHAIDQLESIGIKYQSLDQNGERSIRISENSGITFILTLEGQ